MIEIRVRKKCEKNSLFSGFYRQNMKNFNSIYELIFWFKISTLYSCHKIDK